ncbi:LamG domain-containing protein, partial [Patescibacteria group bacterium]
MRIKNKKKFITIISITGVLLASLVFSLNGYFGGGGKIFEDTFTRNLVGYWSFDEGSGQIAYDGSVYSNNATLGSSGNSDSADPKWTSGKKTGALQFDGDNDYINAGNDNSLEFKNGMTWEMWLKVPEMYNPSYPVSGHQIFQKKTGNYSNVGPGYALWQKVTMSYFMLYLGDGTNVEYKAWDYEDSLDDYDNEFFHLTITLENNGTVKFYFNGDEKLTSTFTTVDCNKATSTDNLLLGDGNYGNLTGFMDEVRIYNRVLSKEEVRYHYNRGAPVGHWKFDEGNGTTAYDSTDNNNDGTLYGGMATSTIHGWTTGKHGSALSFDGSNDYINCGSSTNLNATGSVTIEAWVNTTQSASYVGVVTTQKNSPWTGYALTINNGKLAINDTVGWHDGQKNVNDGQWHHIVAILTNSYSDIYVDGLIDGSFGGHTSWGNSTNLLIGWHTSYFNGEIDDVRIYNYARTLDEIRLDYNAGFAARFGPLSSCDDDPGSCMTEGLLGHWSLDEGTGQTAYDLSDHSYNSTLGSSGGSPDSADPKWLTGKVGSALEFDGIDDYAKSYPDILNGIQNNSTLMAWVRWDALDNYDSPIGHYWRWAIYRSSSDKITATTKLGGSYYTIVATDITMETGKWYHIATTFEDNDWRLYVNGIMESSTTSLSGPIEISENYFLLGQNYDGYFFKGLVDEAKIYNRTLSPTEIRYHYNQGKPVGHWKFDEGNGITAYDFSDDNNNGTLYGGMATSSSPNSGWTTGKYGSALLFDGVDDYVVLPNSFDNVIAGDFSVSAWFRCNGVNVDDRTYQMIIDFRGERNIWFYIDESSKKAEFAMSDGSTNIAYSSQTFDYDKWYHVVAVKKGTTIKVYLNTLKGLDFTSGTPTTVSAETRIGKLYIDSAGGGGHRGAFNGSIDDVRIYNYARTVEQIRQDYNAGLVAHFGPKTNCDSDPGACMTEDLVGYWNFSEGVGTITYDGSDYGNNGTLDGSNWTKGKIDGALQFDGNDDYISVSDNDLWDFA